VLFCAVLERSVFRTLRALVAITLEAYFLIAVCVNSAFLSCMTTQCLPC